MYRMTGTEYSTEDNEMFTLLGLHSLRRVLFFSRSVRRRCIRRLGRGILLGTLFGLIMNRVVNTEEGNYYE